MSSIPIWGASILITGSVFIIGGLLFGFIRYRHFAHPPTNRIEYSNKNRGVCPFDTKSTTSIPPGASQKDQNLCKTINQEKSTSTIQSSTLCHFENPQRWLAKKKNVRQLFDLSAVDSNISFTDSATSLSPPPLPPKDNISPISLPLSPSAPPAPFIMDNTSWELSSIHKKKSGIALPSPTFHRVDSSMQASSSSGGISSKGVIEMESGSRQLLEYDLESMFTRSIVDDTNSTEDEYDYQLQQQHQHPHSIDSILQNNNSFDTKSITSGSVHHVVRDSTVVDGDHRSLTARSIASSIRSRLYDMTSWWPIQDKMIDHFPNSHEKGTHPIAVNIFDATSPLSSIGIYAQDTTHLLSQSNFVSKSTSSCRPSLPSTSSTYSHHVTLNQSKRTDQDQKQKPAPNSPIESEVTFELSRKYSASDNELPPLMFPTFYFELTCQSPSPPPLSLKSVSLNKEEFKPTIATKARSDISTVSIPIHHKVAAVQGRETTTRSAIAAPITKPTAAPIWSSHRNNSTIVGGNSGIKIDKVHRELQAAWNTHRLSSNEGSNASTSIRSSVSQEMTSPPDSVHPRQLNQHLASNSLQLHHRPSSPNEIMTEEFLIQSTHTREESPHPTVSFSSSTVRTMIPENEPIESYIDNQKTTASIQHQHHQHEMQNHTKSALYYKHEMTASGTSESGINDDRHEPRFVRTRSVYRHQRGSISWGDNALTEVVVNNNKTPAQCERDRYLQSLNR